MSLPPQPPPDDGDETVVRDTWGDETVVVPEETVVVPEETVVAEETLVEEPPVRRPPLLWPWLLALLVLVLGGLGAYLYFSQEDERTVPTVVGEPRETAEAQVREAGFEPQAEERENAEPRGIVLEQDPEGGTELEEGETVLLTVSSGPPRETVPDVVGSTEAEARESLRQAGFESRVSRAFSDRPVGVVARQQPAAGETLKEGSTVALVLSKGREPVTVPDVVGAQSSAATATLADAGLEANLVDVPSGEPAGTVVAQNPGPGQSAKRGDTVRLNVAQEGGSTAPATTAPPPATTTSPATTTAAPPPPGPAAVPDAVGSPLADAARAFAGEGLKVSVRHVPSSEPAGQVVAQARPAGSEVPQGTTVQVNVSTGPEPGPQTSVPDVVGQQTAAARSRLAGAGFEVLSIELDDGSAQSGAVGSQTPGGRASAPRGSLVILYVGP